MKRSSAQDGSLSIDFNSALSSWDVTQTTLCHRLEVEYCNPSAVDRPSLAIPL
jgi:hypothetical protein